MKSGQNITLTALCTAAMHNSPKTQCRHGPKTNDTKRRKRHLHHRKHKGPAAPHLNPPEILEQKIKTQIHCTYKSSQPPKKHTPYAGQVSGTLLTSHIVLSAAGDCVVAAIVQIDPKIRAYVKQL